MSESQRWTVDRVTLLLRTLAVLAVTGIAAVQSYLHIEQLALRYGQPRLAAMLLPLSVDGLVAAASFQLVAAARSATSRPAAEARWWHRYGLGEDADPLAQAALLLGVVATLAANVADGAEHGWPGALVAGWPAVAFVVAAEMAIGSIRRARRRASPKRELADAERAPGRHSGRAPSDGKGERDRAPTGPRDAAAAILAGRPSTTGPELAALLKAAGSDVAPRTARRYVAELRPGVYMSTDPEPAAIAANGHGAG